MDLSTIIIQVVGYQDSGKTTLVEKIITHFSTVGLKVGSIKHHGHGGRPQALDENKDSYRHRQAGAAVTSVEGDGTLQLHIQKEKWNIEDILNLYAPMNLDIIVIEGFKQAPYPKIVLLRKKEDLELLNRLSNIIAVLTWFHCDELNQLQYPVYMVNSDCIIDWLNCFVRDQK